MEVWRDSGRSDSIADISGCTGGRHHVTAQVSIVLYSSTPIGRLVPGVVTVIVILRVCRPSEWL